MNALPLILFIIILIYVTVSSAVIAFHKNQTLKKQEKVVCVFNFALLMLAIVILLYGLLNRRRNKTIPFGIFILVAWIIVSITTASFGLKSENKTFQLKGSMALSNVLLAIFSAIVFYHVLYKNVGVEGEETNELRAQIEKCLDNNPVRVSWSLSDEEIPLRCSQPIIAYVLRKIQDMLPENLKNGPIPEQDQRKYFEIAKNEFRKLKDIEEKFADNIQTSLKSEIQKLKEEDRLQNHENILKLKDIYFKNVILDTYLSSVFLQTLSDERGISDVLDSLDKFEYTPPYLSYIYAI